MFRLYDMPENKIPTGGLRSLRSWHKRGTSEVGAKLVLARSSSHQRNGVAQRLIISHYSFVINPLLGRGHGELESLVVGCLRANEGEWVFAAPGVSALLYGTPYLERANLTSNDARMGG